MNQNAPQPSFELPAPLPGNEESGAASFEQSAVPLNPAPQSPTSQSLPPSLPQQPLMPIAPVPTAPVQATASSNPLAADDSDLIEKEWVIKAKQIVAATREDPYTQNREMSRFKADYLKKRYNKDIKIEES